MGTTYEFKTDKGVVLTAEPPGGQDADNGSFIYIRLRVSSQNKKTPVILPDVLHWGLTRDEKGKWNAPELDLWPEGSLNVTGAALQSPFKTLRNDEDVVNELLLKVKKDTPYKMIEFVLYFSHNNSWDNNGGKNFRLRIKDFIVSKSKVIDVSSEVLKQYPVHNRETDGFTFNLPPHGTLYASMDKSSSQIVLSLSTDIPPPLILHWGVSDRGGNKWEIPTKYEVSEGNSIIKNSSLENEFIEKSGRLTIKFPTDTAPACILFVLFKPDKNAWIKNGREDFKIQLKEVQPLGDTDHTTVIDEIVSKETGPQSWTLMHRFNLCHNFCEGMSNDRNGLYIMYIWLRYSALRQLDWQRNFNTQPRELSHALDRLCLKLSSIYADSPQVRHIIPMILSNIGPGGDGQRIRDEILHIMHRNRLKEVNHTFIEQWHQKLHNNATADDIVICKAYIEFQRSHGSLDVFYSVLNSMGVTRERLMSFERPIRSDPEFIPHLRDALIGDFEHYLKILNSVHKGVDLERCCDSVSYIFGGNVMAALRFIVDNRDSMDITIVTRLFTTIKWIRERIRDIIVSERDLGRLKDLLFLDLSLMEYLRVLTERNLHANLGGHTLLELVDLSLENLLLTDLPPVEKANSCPDVRVEIQSCINHIRKINSADCTEWVLSSLSVVERIERLIGLFVDFYYSAFQARAEHLGNRFNAAPWTVTMFTEEVLRGQFPFVVSLLLRYLNKLLRTEAGLRRWQVLSPFEASGIVELYHTLKETEGMEFKQQTVIITDKVSGDEDIPSGVTAVISEEMADIVSHVSVRARNERILFATCFSDEILSYLKSLKGKYVSLVINSQGEVVINELEKPADTVETKRQRSAKPSSSKKEAAKPSDIADVISADDFTKACVGGKSLNLARLRDKLPGWINLPMSAAVPFGVFEKILGHSANENVRKNYDVLIKDLNNTVTETHTEKVSAILSSLRLTVMSLSLPDDFLSLLTTVMHSSELLTETNGTDTETFGTCIKQVWASVWNTRAYYNRKKMQLDGHIDMAVLIQRVIEADYAFVIHTVNPVTRDSEEMFAEVVLGLGETIVGNYPGRALSFTCKKSIGVPVVSSYPGKSVGLYGGGLIFRSDSDAEDLENYAGAGLYDSIITPQPKCVPLDYSNEPLMSDENFRNDTLLSIADIGKAVETALGAPQDIEGVYSGGRFYVVQSRPQVGI
ncbi:phosphohistidine-like domain-containing protein [Candidatus Magnetomonas plexicatena]|uniref:phosphohistidine-like domain-containing protein n=1 Tax=Candidatus Magnetomonas plexicatena TaxID=2552947 RepID=UPI001C763D16|nr:hypothetical protein E2O03_003230 [Nitrospirales bacterium LBB_01]